MLAEIAAANAAFAVIKGALANGKELHQLGSRVFDYFDNKAKIQESATKKGGGSDLEEFMALESGSSSKKRSCVSAWSTLVVRECGATGRSSKPQAARKRREDAKEAAAREAKKRRAERLAQD
jgi:hypothetical protein